MVQDLCRNEGRTRLLQLSMAIDSDWEKIHLYPTLFRVCNDVGAVFLQDQSRQKKDTTTLTT